MQKITLLGVLAMLCLYSQAQWGRQNLDFREIKKPFYTGSWIKQDVSLGKVINYKDSSVTLNDFKDKIIILAFWFTQCTDCIAQFPKEDSLQKEFADDIQFVMVTFNPADKVKKFLDLYKKRTGVNIKAPVIVEDTLLSKAFRHLYDPHYAWIFPDGYIIGQTNENFITAGNISALIKEWRLRKAFFKHLEKEKNENAGSSRVKPIIHNKKTVL
jgi:cytochrome oxidase Cu insertion factor (SCO1/SenC/PrrC family)